MFSTQITVRKCLHLLTVPTGLIYGTFNDVGPAMSKLRSKIHKYMNYRCIYRLIYNGLEFWCVGINHADCRTKWLITSIRTTNLLMSRYIQRYFIFYFDSNMINNKLKGLKCLLLLVCAVAGLLPLNQNSLKHGPKIIPLYIG